MEEIHAQGVHRPATETLLSRIAGSSGAELPGLRHVRDGLRWVRERRALATWEDRILPELLLVGVQRGGTTALSAALHRLPFVVRPRRGKGSHYFSYNYWRGWEWFQSQFPTNDQARRIEGATGHRMVGFDACPYYLFHPQAVSRLATDLPDAKLLVMLRDPVERAFSHYHHSVRHGHESLSFTDAIAAEPDRLSGEEARMASDVEYWSQSHEHHSYVAKGCYADQLERLFELVPRDRVMVIQSEAFYRDPDQRLAELTAWLDIPPVRLAPFDDRNANTYKPMESDLRALLAGQFAEHNDRLYALLGERFDWTQP